MYADPEGNTERAAPENKALDLPMVIGFLQQEFRAFEIERNQWRIERSAMMVRILIAIAIMF